MELNRRDFLKGAGAIGALGAMGTLAACSPAAPKSERWRIFGRSADCAVGYPEMELRNPAGAYRRRRYC